MSKNLSETVVLRRAAVALSSIAVASAVLVGCAAGGPGAEPTQTPAETTEVDPTATAEPEQTESAPELTPEATADETPAAPESDAAEPREELGDANVVVLAALYHETNSTVEVRSIVTSTISEGTCTIVLTDSAGAVQEHEYAALPDAQSTICPTQDVAVPAGDGEWTVEVEFRGDDGTSGRSEALQAEKVS